MTGPTRGDSINNPQSRGSTRPNTFLKTANMKKREELLYSGFAEKNQNRQSENLFAPNTTNPDLGIIR